VADHGSLRYKEVFADPVGWRIWAAATISYVGDFVGLGALLLAGYERSGGHVLGSAAVFGVQAVPAFAVSAGIGPWLDRIPRRNGLLALCLIGAAAVSLPIVLSGLWPVLAAAAIIGGARTAFNSIRTGAVADGMRREVRGRLFALLTVSNQVSEVLGYIVGSAVALTIGAKPALAADAATFVVAALVLSGLRLPAPSRSRQRASMSTGIRTIFGDRTLAALVPVLWVGLSIAAVPQTLAATALIKSDRGWVPAALAAMAAGQAIAATAVGRTRLSEHVLGQFRYITLCGLAFLLTAAGLRIDPLLLVAGNFAIGLCMGWVVAAQTTFVHVIPTERVAHATSTMIGSLIVLEGVGAIVFGAIAGALGVSAAYLLAGVMVTAAGLAGIGYARARPQILDIRRTHAPSPGSEESGSPGPDDAASPGPDDAASPGPDGAASPGPGEPARSAQDARPHDTRCPTRPAGRPGE
jgi:MFS family permease